MRRRREFIAELGGIAAVWPVSTDAQQPALPVIGLLQIGAPNAYDLGGFREGLKEAGYVARTCKVSTARPMTIHLRKTIRRLARRADV
jgi:hypothetical protein